MTDQSGLKSQRWTDEEELLLLSAWLNTNVDPIEGTSRKFESLWAKVATYFNAECRRPRDSQALRKKWALLNKSIQKFDGCYSRVTSMGGSEFNEYDFRNKALSLYKDETSKDFGHISSWEVLKNHQKWKGVNRLGNGQCGKRNQDDMQTSPLNEHEGSQPHSQHEDMPMGQKAAKRLRNEKAVNVSSSNVHFAEYNANIGGLRAGIVEQNKIMQQYNNLYNAELVQKFCMIDVERLTPQHRYAFDMSFQSLVGTLESSVSQAPCTTCESGQ